MTSSIQSELTAMQNATAQMQASKKSTSGSSEMGQDAFLMLMLEQLKNQDPTNPMDNQEFLAQQAQFTQLSEIQKLNTTVATNNEIVQACSLVDKVVTVTDPNDAESTITGKVTSANFTSSDATLTINGTEYPLSLVQSVGANTINN